MEGEKRSADMARKAGRRSRCGDKAQTSSETEKWDERQGRGAGEQEAARRKTEDGKASHTEDGAQGSEQGLPSLSGDRERESEVAGRDGTSSRSARKGDGRSQKMTG